MVSFPKIFEKLLSLLGEVCLFSFLWEFKLKHMETIKKGMLHQRLKVKKLNTFVELVFRMIKHHAHASKIENFQLRQG